MNYINKKLQKLAKQFKSVKGKPVSKFTFFIVSFIVLAIEITTLILLNRWYIDVTTAFQIHILVQTSLAAWLNYLYLKHYDTKLIMLLLASTLFLGPFGTFITITAFIIFMLFSKTSIVFADWFASLFPEEEHIETKDVYERLIFGWDDFSKKTTLVPFMDVIKLGSVDQKRVAIGKITKHFKPEFAGALRFALKDKSNSIRVQAATAIARIEKNFSHKFFNLERKHIEEPKNIPILIKLANHCDSYAHCGLLDKEREKFFRKKAIEHYELALKLKKDFNIESILAHLYSLDNNDIKAFEMFSSLYKSKKLSENSYLWFIETMYKLNKYDQIYSFVKKNNKSDLTPEVKEYFQTWSKNNIKGFLIYG